MTALLVTERALRDRRRGMLGWIAGLGAYVAMIGAVYPAVASADVQRVLRSYPDELKAFFGGSQGFDFSTPAGFLNAELFSLVVPLLLVIVAVGFGARTLAGEGEQGVLDLLLATPLTRGRVLAEKLVALVASVAVPSATVIVTAFVTSRVADYELPVEGIVAAGVGAALVAVLMGLLAMLAGALGARRATAIGLPAAVFAVSYLVVGLGELVSWIEPWRVVSPLYHANGTNPLEHGFAFDHLAVLVAVCCAVGVATWMAFDREDLVR